MKAKHLLLALSAVLLMSSGCKKKKEDPVYYYASGDFRGVNMVFKTTSSFGKFCILSGVCNTFYANPEIAAVNYFYIGLPVTVKAGVTYTSDSSNARILYTDNLGNQYASGIGDSLSINITRWDGHGGTGSGTFSGKLRLSGGTTSDSLYVKNGTFTAQIWYVIQK